MNRTYSASGYSRKKLISGYTPPISSAVNQTLSPHQINVSGVGYLSGKFPEGITTIGGVPTSALIRVILRVEPGELGDGTVVAETSSAPDGTWRVDGLDPSLKFDVVGRKENFNDVIVSNVTPATD